MQIKLLFLASIIALFTSCQKDDVNGSDSTFFKAKVDGTAVETSGLTAFATKDGDSFIITGVFSNQSNMYIKLLNAKGVGKHTIGDLQNFLLYSPNSNTGTRSDRAGATGEVTITEKTATSVKGTFKATTKEANTSTKVYNITEGEFSVNFR
jgi:hypothetical protein